MTASYTGLTSQAASVRVPAGGVVRKDFDLVAMRSDGSAAGRVVVLDAFSVEETRLSAQSLALHEQRNAANIRNVVTAGEFGDSGEGSAVELSKYLPGINVDSSTAGQGVSIRGFPSSGTLVTIDGGEVANSASFGGGRNVELGALRLNNISRIEITKVPTPDLPANAQGGAIPSCPIAPTPPSTAAVSSAAAWSRGAVDLTSTGAPCNPASIFRTSVRSTSGSP